jgi:signal transduction histidine kinase
MIAVGASTLAVGFSAGVGVVSLALAVWTVVVYDTRGVREFSLVLGLVGLWSFNSAAKFLLPTLSQQLVVARVDFALTLLIPLIWYRFASEYVGKDAKLVTEVGGLVIFVATLAVIYVPERTIWTSTMLVSEPYPHYDVIASPIYAGFAVVAGVLFFAGLVRLIEAMLTTRKATLSIATLALGTVLPLFFNAEYLLDLDLLGANYTSVGYGVFMIVAATTVFSNLFTVNPIARKTILANVNDGVLVLDHQHRIADYNDRLLEYFLPVQDAVIGSSFAETFPAIASELTLADGAETIIEREAGRTRYYQVTSTRIDNEEGSTIGWNVVVTDVTALKRQQAELERQNEQLDRFTSTVSHDLRNPVSVVSGNVEILSFDLEDGRETAPQEGYATVDADAFEDRLDTVSTAAERMETIIDDLLALARGGQSVEDRSLVDLAGVAEDAWAVVDSKDATLTVAADGQVVANRSRLRTIFENLFRNAIDHVGPDVSIRVTLDGDELAVADDGPGIPEAERDQVFEFGHTTSEEGSGLGLSIVKTIADGHGWDVSIDPTYGDGTRFVFSGVDRLLPDERRENAAEILNDD